MLLFSCLTIVVRILIIHFVSYLICHPCSDCKVHHCPTIVTSISRRQPVNFLRQGITSQQSWSWILIKSHLGGREEGLVLPRIRVMTCVCVSRESGTDWLQIPPSPHPPPPSPASLPQHQTTSSSQPRPANTRLSGLSGSSKYQPGLNGCVLCLQTFTVSSISKFFKEASYGAKSVEIFGYFET